MINGRLARAFDNNQVRVQHSLNVTGGGKRGLREFDYSSVPMTTRNWRKQTLMQKAQHTLNEIHESARANRGRSIDRVVTTAAVTNNQSELAN